MTLTLRWSAGEGNPSLFLYSPARLRELFENVDISQITITDIVGSDYTVKVRVSGSIDPDFELETIRHKSKPHKTCRVTGIHP